MINEETKFMQLIHEHSDTEDALLIALDLILGQLGAEDESA